MNTREAIDFMRTHPVFWSRLGFGFDPPLKTAQGELLIFGEDGPYIEEHGRFAAAGTDIHTFILPSGWVGADEYDYTVTDRILDSLFEKGDVPYVMPRIKLNVPVDWCRKYPREVLVYENGPRDEDGIRSLVGTLKQDYLGYESELGYYCANGQKFDRPNVGGVISLQSFSSRQWLKDASEALRRLIEHIESKPYADRVLGYHIAYGACGESMLWGRQSWHNSDWGLSNRQRFLEWGAEKYGSEEAALQQWGVQLAEDGMVDIPSAEQREPSGRTPDTFFRSEEKDLFSLDYDRFIGETNTDALMTFGRVIKNITDKPVGAFYGYFMYVERSTYTGFLELQRLLDSDAIDFFAAPKCYYRCLPGEPGNSMCPMLSVNRVKLWIDESDNRTHLCNNGESNLTATNMEETRTVLWREVCKNVTQNAGFWWMDLGGGWYDDDEIMAEIKKLCGYTQKVRDTAYRSVSEILAVVDEEAMYYSSSKGGYHLITTNDTVANLKLSGAPIDVLRMKDMADADLSGYKLVIFLNPLCLTQEKRDAVLARLNAGAVVMYNYVADVSRDGSMAHSKDVTGFETSFRRSREQYPLFAVRQSAGVQPMAHYADASIRMAKRMENGRTFVMNGSSLILPEEARALAELAGCRLYAPMDCAVYADSRVIGVFPHGDVEDGYIDFGKEIQAYDAVKDTDYGTVSRIELPLKAKRAHVFFRKA